MTTPSTDDIPILKRLTALEPEMDLPPAVESPTLEISDSDVEEPELSVVETIPMNAQVGFRVEMPVWIWLSVIGLWLAYMWGIAYALTPVRDLYQRDY